MRSVLSLPGVAFGLLLSVLVSGTALSATAPATPAFMIAWGSSGSAAARFSNPVGVATSAQGDVYVADSGNQRVQKFDHLGTYLTQWGSAGSGNSQFNTPYGIVVDASGIVYVLDNGNNRIQRFTATGAYLSQWGSLGGGPGQFSGPQGIAIDAAGNVYVADSGNDRIQKFTGSGVFVTQWGSYGNGNGLFSTPARIATDPAGNVYVSDFGNNRVQKFSSAGTYLAQWGSAGGGDGQFSGAAGIVADAVGNIYVSEYFGNRIQKFDATGFYLTQWGSAGSGSGQFNGPSGISVDAAGNVYVADLNNARIQKFSGAGASAPVPVPPAFLLAWGQSGFGNAQFNIPRGVAVDGLGNVYVTDMGNNRVQKFGPGGAYLTQWGSTGTGIGQFSSPFGVATDASNNVYVTDYSNNRVQKFTSGGAYVTQWGSSGGGSGQFSAPTGITTDAAGNVYVVDAFNSRVQKFSATGTYLTQWGSSGSGNGQFSSPGGVAVDAVGDVYVLDNNNNRIQKFTATGTYLTQWGSAGSGAGQFIQPTGVAIDAGGYVYVSEFNNNRIQKFTSSGTYLTEWGSAGAGNGQFSSPTAIATSAGNFYVTDAGNARVQKFVAPPAIALISDVGNDQGKQVRLRILHSAADAAGSGATITGYAIYRRIDPLSVVAGWASAIDPARRDARDFAARSARPNAVALAGWDYVTTVPARGDAEYNVVVPTLADANASSLYYTAFFASALTQDPYVYTDSPVEHGYSIDNLPPLTPAPFAAAYASGATHLHWGASEAADFASFRLYRGTSAGFLPGAGNLVTATADTGYADVGPAGRYYKLSAVDRNGNESQVAVVTPAATTDVPGSGLPREVELAGAFPNPLRVGGTFHYALPRAMRVSLALHDIAGRRVRVLAEGERPAGEASVRWDGRDEAGHVLPAGLLVLRLVADGRSLTRRVVTLE